MIPQRPNDPPSPPPTPMLWWSRRLRRAQPTTNPSLLAHLRDIFLLPFMVTVVVPYSIFDPKQNLFPDHTLVQISGIIIAVGGLTLLSCTIFLFGTRGKGTLAPWSPTQKLVISGPYRYCRNPMITGVLFILFGESLFLHSTSILWWAGLFFLINTAFFILYEEPSMLERFGDDYVRYKKYAPRWIPRSNGYIEADPARDQRTTNKEF